MMRQPEDRVLYIAHAESRLGASGMARLHAHRFDWRFAHPPEAGWPALADTGRFNEAAGLPKHAVREVAQPDGSVRFFAEARIGPVALAWEDIPVEWVEGQWLRHLRIFSRGPLRSLCASLRLRSDGTGGTAAHYLIEAERSEQHTSELQSLMRISYA